MPITTQQHSPYFDDFISSSNENKNFQQILFKPGYSVQNRELNQIQSMLRAQIDKFGSSFYTNGAAVVDGLITFKNDIYSVDIETTAELAAASTALKNQDGVTADIIGYELTDDVTTTYRFFLRYSKSDTTNGTTRVFAVSDTIDNTDTNAAIGAVLRVGYSLGFFINKGIFFVNGSFVVNDSPQRLFVPITSGQLVNGFAAFKITESIITAVADETLFDNATGSPNFQAPGADRQAINLELVFIYDDNIPSYDFAKLLTIVNSQTLKPALPNSNSSDAKSLDDLLATRTFEESGNYSVRPFKLDVKEYFNDGTNFGKYTLANLPSGIDEAVAKTKYIAGIEPSIAYVKGYRIVLTDRNDLVGNKARNTTETVENITFTARQDNYIVSTSLDIPNNGALPDINNTTLTYNLYGEAAATTFIGACRIRNIEYVTNGAYNIFIYDLVLCDGKRLSDAKFLALTTVIADVDVHNFANTAGFSLFGTSNNTNVFPFPYEAIDSITSLRYGVRTSFTATPSSTTVNGIAGIWVNIPHPNLSSSKFEDTSPSNYIVVDHGGVVRPVTSVYIDTNSGVYLLVPGAAQGGANTASIIAPTIVTSIFNSKSALTAATQTVSSATYTVNSSRAVTFTDAGDYVSIAGGHGLREGDRVSFSSIVSTTGIYTQTTYYVIYTDTTRFQLALYRGDHKVEFSTNGTGIMASTNIIGLTNVDIIASSVQIMNGGTNVTSKFTIEDGITSNYFKTPLLVYKDSSPLTSALTITYSYYPHTAATGKPYIVNSYSALDGLEDIPKYAGVRLGDCIDFRYDNGETAAVRLDSNSTIVATVSHYLPRVDNVLVNSAGQFYIDEGSAAVNPVAPAVPKDAMNLYSLYVPAYTFSTDEIVPSFIDNKRYTMRDIGNIEKRVSNIEYYTSLSLLERSAQDKQILTAGGLQRYKNGIIVDSFFGHNIGDVTNAGYKCSVDSVNGQLLPYYTTTLVDLKVDSASKTNALLSNNNNTTSIAYTDEKIIEQTYATANAESVNPFNMTMWNGAVELSPSSDEWKSTIVRPDVIVNDNNAYDAIAFSAQSSGLLGYHWNEWEVNWTGAPVVNRGAKHVAKAPDGVMRRKTTTTVTSTSLRDGTRTTLSYTDNKESLGEKVVDISYIPFIRSRKIYFTATRLKPNTRVYPFFDGVDISAYTVSVPLIDVVQFKNQTDSTIYDGVAVGSLGITATPVISDSTGKANGYFIIPNNSDLKFKTGQRSFRLTDSLTNNPNDFTTIADSTYYATGILETKENTIISTRIPRFDTTKVSDSRTNAAVVKVTWDDPLAQSFILDEKQTDGAYITKLDLYFKTKSTKNIPVSVHIVSMENGMPTQNIIPFSALTKDAADVVINPSAPTTPTTFVFSSPVYLQPGIEYAFVVMSNDSDYMVYVSEVGKENIVAPYEIIAKNPYAGVLFKSQNGSTWTADQNKDMKFSLYRAKFSTTNVTREVIIQGVNQPGNDSLSFSTLKTTVENITQNNTNISWKLYLTDVAFVTPFEYDININETLFLPRRFTVKRDGIKLVASLSTSSDYVAPYIDCDRSSVVLIDNQINSDTSTELTLDNGSATARYITRAVELNNPANQLNIYLGARLPSPSEAILVYAKIQTKDTDIFANNPWVLLPPTTAIPISSNVGDFQEISYQYAPGNSFSTWSVKIVFTSSVLNGPNVPSITDFRAIATYA